MATDVSAATATEMLSTEVHSESVEEHAGSENAEVFVTRVRIHPDSQLALWPQALTRRERPIQDGWIQPGSAVGEELSLRRFPGYTREATAAPPVWVAPTREMVEEVAALHSYRDLFLDNGDAVHKAMEWARNPTGQDLEKVVPFDETIPRGGVVVEEQDRGGDRSSPRVGAQGRIIGRPLRERTHRRWPRLV